jgi:hypothetical protein
MYTELHKTIREMLICCEIILEFEALDPQQAEVTLQIHRWASFLSNLCEKISQLSSRHHNVALYFRTMEAPLRRILDHTEMLLEEQFEPLSLNQEYSFQRIHRMAQKASNLAQTILSEMPRPKPNDAPLIK